MRRTVTVFIMLGCFTNLGAQWDTVHAGPGGCVFIRELKIEPPWEFTGIGGDTLRLNGVPYCPTRQDFRHKEPVPLSTLPDSARVLAKAQFDLSRRASAARHAGMTTDEAIDAEVAVYRASDLVDSVEIGCCCGAFTVYWKDGPPETAYTSSTLSSTSKPSKLEIHQGMVEEFRREMNMGRILFVFKCGHSISCDSKYIPATLEVIDRAKKGLSISRELRERSCFRSDIEWTQLLELLSSRR
jgi:hypothetical protein